MHALHRHSADISEEQRRGMITFNWNSSHSPCFATDSLSNIIPLELSLGDVGAARKGNRNRDGGEGKPYAL